jgi:hypothetical protein
MLSVLCSAWNSEWSATQKLHIFLILWNDGDTIKQLFSCIITLKMAGLLAETLW